MDGPSLSERVKSGPLALEKAVAIGAQIAQGLQEAHQNKIIHRDIKSANILLSSKGQVKIGDFGIALLADRSRLTQSGTSLGTVAYMSPEQALGKRADRRSDIWSLGVVLFEMVAGRLPFGGKHEHVITYSVLNEEPNPLGAARPNLPMRPGTHRQQGPEEGSRRTLPTHRRYAGRPTRGSKEAGVEKPSAGDLTRLFFRAVGTQ